MSDYRPVTDVWMMARPKVKYWGAYPSGFLERAVILLGVSPVDNLLHLCGGHAKQYPAWSTLCPKAKTLDLDPLTKPDFCQDARQPLPCADAGRLWDAILIDPPYTIADAKKYAVGSSVLPSANELLRNALRSVRLGGRVGVLHYVFPQPPNDGVKLLACVAVVAGYNNRMRCFSVFERRAIVAKKRAAV